MIQLTGIMKLAAQCNHNVNSIPNIVMIITTVATYS